MRETRLAYQDQYIKSRLTHTAVEKLFSWCLVIISMFIPRRFGFSELKELKRIFNNYLYVKDFIKYFFN